MATLKGRLEGMDAFTLAATKMMASLAASLAIALAALEEDADAEVLWAAANLEEDWQAELWGWDPAAKTRRDAKQADFARAMEFARLARP
jgi:chaperone required for assembly of F1-ATPase